MAWNAYAIPITWELDIEITGGNTVTGSYVYDADTNIFSDVNVSAVGGLFPLSSSALTTVLGDYSDSDGIDFVPTVADYTGYEDVYISLYADMTNAGGIIEVTELYRYICHDSTCDDYDQLFYTEDLVGTVSSTMVPEPASLALLCLGLATLSLCRRKKSLT